jgi:hypothetical protein
MIWNRSGGELERGVRPGPVVLMVAPEVAPSFFQEFHPKKGVRGLTVCGEVFVCFATKLQLRLFPHADSLGAKALQLPRRACSTKDVHRQPCMCQTRVEYQAGMPGLDCLRRCSSLRRYPKHPPRRDRGLAVTRRRWRDIPAPKAALQGRRTGSKLHQIESHRQSHRGQNLRALL